MELSPLIKFDLRGLHHSQGRFGLGCATGAEKGGHQFSAGDGYAIIAMVEKGLGSSILPELVTRFQHEHVALLELKERSFRSLGLAGQLDEICFTSNAAVSAACAELVVRPGSDLTQ